MVKYTESKIEAVRLARRYFGMNPVIFDTETTGLGPYAEICDISIVDTDGTVLFESLIKPIGPIDPEASAITHITDAMVANAPSILDVLPRIREVLKGRVVGAYNADFDFRLLHASICLAGNRKGDKHVALIEFDSVFDIIRIGALYYGEWNPKFRSWKNKKLVELAGSLSLPVDETLHRASADAKLTAKVLEAIAVDPNVPDAVKELGAAIDENYEYIAELKKQIDAANKTMEIQRKEIADTIANRDGYRDAAADLRTELASKEIVINARQDEINRLAEKLLVYTNGVEIREPFSASPDAVVTVADPIVTRRINEIVKSNPYILTRSDWETVYKFLRPIVFPGGVK